MIGWLRALERVTRPPRRPWGDLDTPLDGAEQLAEREADRDSWEPGELIPPPSNLDDVVVLLAHLDCCVEDIRNLLNSSPPAGLTTNTSDAPAGVDADPPTRPPAGPEPIAEVCKAHRDPDCKRCDDEVDDLWIHPRDLPEPPDLATWLEPAICEVLAEHVPSPDRGGNDPAVICHDSTSHRRYLGDWQAWRQHVAPLIAAHIVKSLAVQPK